LASYLIERAPEVLSKPMTDLGIEILICGGEPGAGVPEIPARLERGYGARLFDLGGGPGISCDHEEYQGMHFVADDLMLYELFDPATGEPIELKDGAEGEQALTSLVPGAGGRGFVRLTFGDMHRVEKSQCPCGRTGFRYRIIGRSDDMLKVKGVIVYPAAVAGVISQFEPRVTGQFRIVLESPPPLVTPPLRLTVERGFNTSIDQLDELAKEMAGAMHSRLRVRPTIDWVDPGSLGRESHKTQLLDKRYGSRT
jgi:phenylacetate-CoA ligase